MRSGSPRGVQLPHSAIEPTPLDLAHRLALEAMLKRDPVKLERMLGCLDLYGLWLTTRRMREVASRDARVSCSILVLHELERRLGSPERAAEHRASLSGAAMPVEKLDLYLARCIDEIFDAELPAQED